MAQKVAQARKKRKAAGLWGLDIVMVRNASQIGFSLFLLYIGWRFYWFVKHFESGAPSAYVDRPPSVEAFLPISALIALKNWVVNGDFDVTHPAGLAIFVAVLLVSWAWRKGFCSWICPIGALSELLERLGRKAWGPPSRVPKIVDRLFMSLKYLILLFFAQAVLIGMNAGDVAIYLDTPFNKIADVKMLYFFTQLGSGTVVVIFLLVAFSTLVSNLWCRYLCPYGALLGLLSLFSPVRVVRSESRCTGCNICTKACPNYIDVAKAGVVSSPECTSCLRCVSACPRRGALAVKAVGGRAVNPFAFAVLLLASFFLVLAIAQATGHWVTNLTYADYAELIPRAREFSH